MLGVGKLILLFEKLSGGKMRLRIFGLQGCGLMVGAKGVLWLACLEQMSQREPRALLSCGYVTGGLQLSRGAQEFLRLRLVIFRELQAQIQIRLEDVGLGRDRFPVGRDGVVDLAQRVVDKSQIKPRDVIRWIGVRDLAQQRLGIREILLLNEFFRLGQFGRRTDFLFDCGVMSCRAGFSVSLLTGRRIGPGLTCWRGRRAWRLRVRAQGGEPACSYRRRSGQRMRFYERPLERDAPFPFKIPAKYFPV